MLSVTTGFDGDKRCRFIAGVVVYSAVETVDVGGRYTLSFAILRLVLRRLDFPMRLCVVGAGRLRRETGVG